MLGAERRPSVPPIAGLQKGAEGLTTEPEQRNPERGVSRIEPRERLQVSERLKGERQPLFIIRRDERYQEIARWRQLPGTLVRISPQGDIAYPVWQERTRVNKPELYQPLGKLPRGWSFERLLASQRRPISEAVFHQVRKERGAVEAAIRNMDHVIGEYQEKGRELEQVKTLRRQIDQAMAILEKIRGVSREEFKEAFDILYNQTLRLMEDSGMSRARAALKKDIERLLSQAATGEDRLGRSNLMAMLKKLEAASRRVEYRRNEADFIVSKFAAMKAGLMVRREADRERLEKARHESSVGLAAHPFFRTPPSPDKKEEKEVKNPKGDLIGRIGTLIYQLKQVRVKPYKPVAEEAITEFERIQELIRKDEYQRAAKIFPGVREQTSFILDQFAQIYFSSA